MAADHVRRIVAAIGAQPDLAGSYAALLRGSRSPVALDTANGIVRELMAGLVATVVSGGWAPSDLAEITRRRLSARHLPALAALLAAETARHPSDRVAAEWRADLAGLGPAVAADLETADGLEATLGLCGVFATLPAIAAVIPPPGARGTGSGPLSHPDAKLLGKVRSLLAKAESTDYAEEAETLSAKAQELISRYALDRLVQEAGREESSDRPVVARRLWIDPPYVVPKAMLIDAVAGANRCRSVVAESLGFSTVVGQASDLDAVELLATSLLVQANTAMLRYGRQPDRGGRSRTTSFRRSFLVSYALRIGERLRAATRDAVDQTGRVGALVPVLKRHGERVDAALGELFPHTAARETSISNGHGWAAGRAAADLAQLDMNLPITRAAG